MPDLLQAAAHCAQVHSHSTTKLLSHTHEIREAHFQRQLVAALEIGHVHHWFIDQSGKLAGEGIHRGFHLHRHLHIH